MQYELQLFNGRDYVTTYAGELQDVQREFAALPRGKPRRIVLTSKARDVRPRYRKPPRASINAGRTIQGTIQAYLAWSNRACAPAVAFYDDSLGRGYARTCGKPHRFVDPAEHLGPAPIAETIESSEDVTA